MYNGDEAVLVNCTLTGLCTSLKLVAAAPGRTVTMMSRAEPQPMHVQRAEWNLRTDEIRVESGTAGGSRR